jgi:ABC-2 type transport system permease protein
MAIARWSRFCAVLAKEFIQMRRDRLTFAMLLGIPLLQLILFGFAINTDPKHLPTLLRFQAASIHAEAIRHRLEALDYFAIERRDVSDPELDRLFLQGRIQFAVTIPADFDTRIALGDTPSVTVEADATDPLTTSNALCAVQTLLAKSLALRPVALKIIKRYNPEGRTTINIVPGLMGLILTLSMILMTALVMTRERERGTMEGLLATPVRAIEVIAGKVLPYILIGYAQVLIILLAMHYVFAVPIRGSIALLLLCSLVFILANLLVGLLISLVTRSQMQSMQICFFFFLPSALLSGFMFPFRGMPRWAQALGELLPITHYLRIVRAIVLKGAGFADVHMHLWPLLVFLLIVAMLGRWCFRGTLE